MTASATNTIYIVKLGAIHTRELDRSEIDLSPKRTEIDLRSIQLRSILVCMNGP